MYVAGIIELLKSHMSYRYSMLIICINRHIGVVAGGQVTCYQL